jgi:hypothetical protein
MGMRWQSLRQSAPFHQKRPKFSALGIGVGMITGGAIFKSAAAIVNAVFYWFIGDLYPTTAGFNGQPYSWFLYIAGILVGGLYAGQGYDFLHRTGKKLTKTLTLLMLISFLHGLGLIVLVYEPALALSSIELYSFMVRGFVSIAGLLCVVGVYYCLTRFHNVSYKNLYLLPLFAVFFCFHLCIITQYSPTLNVVMGARHESKGELQKAIRYYKRSMPYLSSKSFKASLNHRLALFSVSKNEPEKALDGFRKVVSVYDDYSHVYDKAKKYLESFEENSKSGKLHLLEVKHKTFHQPGSCFPNSLAMVLSYLDKPVNTRELSREIKESFHQGTFIWKASTFVEKNGFEMITIHRQDVKTIQSLLDMNYPVLVYIPGHVYVLYGYDSRFELFFTYDTAVRNNWDDKPFKKFQEDWTESGFTLSVVVPKEKVNDIYNMQPELKHISSAYKIMQKAHISRYYNQRGIYPLDYNQEEIIKQTGSESLFLSHNELNYSDLSSIKYNNDFWDRLSKKLSDKPWLQSYYTMDNFFYFLVFHKKDDLAWNLLDKLHKYNMEQNKYSYKDLSYMKFALAFKMNKQDELTKLKHHFESKVENSSWRYQSWAHYLSFINKKSKYFDSLKFLFNRQDYSDSDNQIKSIKHIALKLKSPEYLPENISSADMVKLRNLWIYYGIRVPKDKFKGESCHWPESLLIHK